MERPKKQRRTLRWLLFLGAGVPALCMCAIVILAVADPGFSAGIAATRQQRTVVAALATEAAASAATPIPPTARPTQTARPPTRTATPDAQATVAMEATEAARIAAMEATLPVRNSDNDATLAELAGQIRAAQGEYADQIAALNVIDEPGSAPGVVMGFDSRIDPREQPVEWLIDITRVALRTAAAGVDVSTMAIIGGYRQQAVAMAVIRMEDVRAFQAGEINQGELLQRVSLTPMSS